MSAAGDPSQSAAVPASDTVTLSASAQAFASLNAKGVTVFTVNGPGLSSGAQPSGPIALYGSVSKQAFATVAADFGATAQQVDQDFAAMDTNGDGSISNAEMLDAMSQTAQGTSPFSQGLRQLMDTNHDGSVSSSEFVNFESAMVYAER